MYREEDFGAAREVLDIAVSAVFGPAGNSSCALFSNLCLEFACGRTCVRVLGLWGFGDGAVEVRVGGDEFRFALVPGVEDFG